MNSRPATLLIILVAILLSCDDNDYIVYRERIFRKFEILNRDYRLFASDGEIKDQKVINKHGEFDTQMFEYATQELMYEGRLDTLFIENENEIIISNQYRRTACDVTKAGNHDLILMPRDTVRGITAMNEYSHHVDYFIGEAKPTIFSEKLISSVRGVYQFSFSARQPLMITRHEREVTVHVLLYRWSFYSNGVLQAVYPGRMYNKLNEDFHKELSATDTVSVMEASIYYRY